MNNVTQEKKDSVTKTLAIVGFVAAILFAVWLAVQIVSVIPSAFNSLASIADGVYNYSEDQTLTVATPSSVVNTGEAFVLTWSKINRPGAYSFSYNCTDGAALDARNSQGNIISLDCDTSLLLEEKTSLDVVVTSEKQRFTDISYSVTFKPENVDAEPFSTQSRITIVNVSIPTSPVASEETQDTSEEQTGIVAGESTTNTETSTEDTRPNPGTGLVAGTPKIIEEIIYAIPTSDPNGEIDLEVTLLGAGTLTGTTFTRDTTIDRDVQGAFQFEVRNIGTKTSNTWSYLAKLPSGIEYNAGVQEPLKPNEKAIITIGFEGLTQLGIEHFSATVTANGDIDSSNNSFEWAIQIVE